MNESPFNLEHQNKSIESKILASLERISQAFRVLLWNEGKELSLTPIQIQILTFLFFHSSEKNKVSYLAQEFNMTKATISDTVKTLEQKELIEKKYIEADTRSFIIELTSKGKELVKKTSGFTNELQVPIEKLSKDEKENLLLSLIDIIKHLNKVGVITVQRMCFTCSHYRNNHYGSTHFCSLLNQALHTSDLRVDCLEHQV